MRFFVIACLFSILVAGLSVYTCNWSEPLFRNEPESTSNATSSAYRSPVSVDFNRTNEFLVDDKSSIELLSDTEVANALNQSTSKPISASTELASFQNMPGTSLK